MRSVALCATAMTILHLLKKAFLALALLMALLVFGMITVIGMAIPFLTPCIIFAIGIWKIWPEKTLSKISRKMMDAFDGWAAAFAFIVAYTVMYVLFYDAISQITSTSAFSVSPFIGQTNIIITLFSVFFAISGAIVSLFLFGITRVIKTVFLQQYHACRHRA